MNLTAGKTPGVFAQVKAAITGAWHDAGEATKRFSENLKDAAAKAVGSLISGGQSIGATMKSFASSAYDSAAGAAAAFAGLPPQLGIVLAQPLKKVFGKIGSFIGGIFGGGKKAAEKMAEAARKAAEAGFHPSGRPHDLDNRQRPIPPPRVLGAGRVQDQRVSKLRRAGEDRPRYKPSSACDPRRTRRRVSAPDFW